MAATACEDRFNASPSATFFQLAAKVPAMLQIQSPVYRISQRKQLLPEVVTTSIHINLQKKRRSKILSLPRKRPEITTPRTTTSRISASSAAAALSSFLSPLLIHCKQEATRLDENERWVKPSRSKRPRRHIIGAAISDQGDITSSPNSARPWILRQSCRCSRSELEGKRQGYAGGGEIARGR